MGCAFGVGAGEGRDELVGDSVVIELGDAGDRVGVGAAFGVAGDHRVEGLQLLLPAEVAVHGEVAAGDGGDLADADLAHLLLESFEVAEAAGGQRVAAVHEGMDEDVGEALLFREAQQSVEVALVRVDSAVGEEADEVERPSLLGGELAGSDEDRVGVEAAVADGGVDAGHVHADDAAGAEVEVADFAVAHLAVGEADEVLAGADEGVGEVAQELVVGRFARERDGVAERVGAVTPAVEDG